MQRYLFQGCIYQQAEIRDPYIIVYQLYHHFFHPKIQYNPMILRYRLKRRCIYVLPVHFSIAETAKQEQRKVPQRQEQIVVFALRYLLQAETYNKFWYNQSSYYSIAHEQQRQLKSKPG